MAWQKLCNDGDNMEEELKLLELSEVSGRAL